MYEAKSWWPDRCWAGRLPVRQTDHAAIPALMSKEVEHIGGGDQGRVLRHHREERRLTKLMLGQALRGKPAGHLPESTALADSGEHSVMH